MRSGVRLGLVAIAMMTAVVTGAACAKKNSSGPGIVPPDLRDVERDGEGLVSTTFGSYPDRVPDWNSAGTVLTLLQTVWTRAKGEFPEMPEARVAQIDAAIASLGTAIATTNQMQAVTAANQVGLAVPDIFASFHPDAPEQIVRMDAVFRQVGIDAHFNGWSAAAGDLASLTTDWNDSKASVAMRSPKCHRVGGTATVAGDIDQSLANLATAIPAMVRTSSEIESENGALEIDTLELLYDCPPDGPAPAHGLGATCTMQSDCDGGFVCDTANAGGRCAPSATTAKVGIACTSTVDCGTDPRSACNNQAGDGFPGGYCTMEPCNDVQVCSPGATCVALAHETPACFRSCTADTDCRTAEGYVCQLFSTTPPTGFGPSSMACAFKCTTSSDCNSPFTCDVPTGKCKP